MTSRRQFLGRAAATGFGLGLALPTNANQGADVASGLNSEYRDHQNAEVFRAVERGLAYLANTQLADGSFGDTPTFQGNLAVASLAGLAFLAGGHTPLRGAIRKNRLAYAGVRAQPGTTQSTWVSKSEPICGRPASRRGRDV